jgi:D-inositol-3-phosphate glycosyltransferase
MSVASSIKRLAIICVHASPLAMLGGKKAGGMNVYVREIAQEFASRGIIVDIFTRRTSETQPYIDQTLGTNVNVVHVKSGPIAPLDPDDVYPYLSEFSASIIAYATKYQVEYPIVYSHYWLSGWVANKLKEVWGMPFIQMFHTLGEMKNRIGAGDVARLPNLRIAEEMRIVAWADMIVAATEAENYQLLWLYRADRRKIVIVPPGVDAEQFYPISHTNAQVKLGFDKEKRLFLFVGRIEPLKAVDTIIEAVSLIKRECQPLAPLLQVAIVGGDPNDMTDQEMVRLKAFVEAQDVADIVQFLGAREHHLLPEYYAAATALIMPSDYESFGMVALEAMAVGTPVIATEVGGLAFLVKDGETGFHIPSRDPRSLAKRMLFFVTQPEQRQLLSKNAVILAQQYRWSLIADRLLSTFEMILDQAGINRRKH